MAAIACLSCGRTEHAVRRPLTRSEPAPWRWLRSILPVATMIERRVGSVVTCHGCGKTFCIGDGGPRDIWSPPDDANLPFVPASATRVDAHQPLKEREPDDLAFRRR